MNTKGEKVVHVATPLPISQRDQLVKIGAPFERKVAAELRVAIRKHIEANRHLLEGGDGTDL